MRNKEIEKHFRFEFKYLLDPVTYMKVRDFVESIGMMHDPSVPGGKYKVTSLYFDTFGLDDYYDKLGGFKKRKKVRARIYGKELDSEDQEVHLETKHKHDMYIGKKRTKVAKGAWKSFINKDSDEILDEFGLNIKAEGRVPTVVVRYDREAFIESFLGRVRLTFDQNIEAIKHDDLEYLDDKNYDATSVLDQGVIMEIKFNDALPWWFGFMVREFDLKRTAYSKYANSLDRIYRHNPLPR